MRPPASIACLAVLCLWGCGGDDAAAGVCASTSDCGRGGLCVDGACRRVEPRPDGGPGTDGARGCPSPRMVCGGECVDVLRSPMHCGVCDTPCAAPSACASGRCIAPCTPADPPVEVCNGVDDDCDGEVDPADCRPGLIAWYRFEGTSGPVVDASGNGLDGEAMGAVVRGVGGHDGHAISLDGDPASMIRIADAPELTFGEAFTAEAWVSPLDCAHAGSDHNTVVAKEGEVLLAFDTSCGVANYIDNGAWQSDAPALSVPLLSWTHYAVTYDGAMVRSYVNGRAAGPGTALTGPIPDTMVDLVIGARPDCCTQTLRGRVDEVKIWNVVRSAPDLCRASGHTWEDATATCG